MSKFRYSIRWRELHPKEEDEHFLEIRDRELEDFLDNGVSSQSACRISRVTNQGAGIANPYINFTAANYTIGGGIAYDSTVTLGGTSLRIHQDGIFHITGNAIIGWTAGVAPQAITILLTQFRNEVLFLQVRGLLDLSNAKAGAVDWLTQASQDFQCISGDRFQYGGAIVGGGNFHWTCTATAPAMLSGHRVA